MYNEMIKNVDLNILFVLLIFILFDVSTGFIKSLQNHSIKSSLFREGGFKKFLVIIIIVMSILLDNFLFKKSVLYTCTTTYFIVNETISICENLKKIGIKIPNKFLSTVKKIQDEDTKK